MIALALVSFFCIESYNLST